MTTVASRNKEADVDQAEARRRLESSTRFQFVGERVLIRSATLLEAHKESDKEYAPVLSGDEQGGARDASLVMAA